MKFLLNFLNIFIIFLALKAFFDEDSHPAKTCG